MFFYLLCAWDIFIQGGIWKAHVLFMMLYDFISFSFSVSVAASQWSRDRANLVFLVSFETANHAISKMESSFGLQRATFCMYVTHIVAQTHAAFSRALIVPHNISSTQEEHAAWTKFCMTETWKSLNRVAHSPSIDKQLGSQTTSLQTHKKLGCEHTRNSINKTERLITVKF